MDVHQHFPCRAGFPHAEASSKAPSQNPTFTLTQSSVGSAGLGSGSPPYGACSVSPWPRRLEA